VFVQRLVDLQPLAVAQRARALQDVAQLAHVAQPVVAAQPLQILARDLQ
jgi:hypothetical protein